MLSSAAPTMSAVTPPASEWCERKLVMLAPLKEGRSMFRSSPLPVRCRAVRPSGAGGGRPEHSAFDGQR